MNANTMVANPTQEQVKNLIQAVDNVLAALKSSDGDADPMMRILNGPAAGDAMVLMSSLTNSATQRLMGMMQGAGAASGGSEMMNLIDLRLNQAPVFVAATESTVVLPMGKLVMTWVQEDGVTKVDSFSFKPNIWWFITHPMTTWRLIKARQALKKAASS
jgi:hypothetical protein